MSNPDDYIAALRHGLGRPEAYPHAVRDLHVSETHISILALTGDYAYKLKKPVKFNFVDYSTLDQRRFFCEEELRLNRRLAPELYLDVVPIAGPPEACRVGGAGDVCDYAVRMKQFDAGELLPEAIKAKRIQTKHFATLGRDLAAFHRSLAGSEAPSGMGAPQLIARNTSEVFEILRVHCGDAIRPHVTGLDAWRQAEETRLSDAFLARQHGGFIRECHGDLHLGNLILQEDAIVAFDGIEFNTALRWIDVMSEAAFLVMDLEAHSLSAEAFAFFNAYLEETGDYEGLRVAPYYLVYRAAVREMVHLLRASQEENPHEQRESREAASQYLAEAGRRRQPGTPTLTITHGVSGSGKTFASERVMTAQSAIRIRSDLERKRLAGIHRTERAGEQIYSADATEKVYARLEQLAEVALAAGFPVVIDATFLLRRQRERFRDLADKHGVPFQILACSAPEETLRERIEQRAIENRDASDATLGVLEKQLRALEPLSESERAFAVVPLASGPELMGE